MSYSCECGAQHGFEFRDGTDVCRFCGRVRDIVRQPLLVVTGGAATGKSTICRVWERDPRVFSLDLDVVGNDAFVRKTGNNDYVALWGFNLRLALEIQLNGLAPLLCGFCYPEQVVANAECSQFRGVHVLALTCDEDEMQDRITQRAGGEVAAARARAISRELNQDLRTPREIPSGSYTVLETGGTSVEQAVASASGWIEERLVLRDI